MAKTTKTIIGIIIAVIVIAGIWYGVSKKPAPAPTGKEPIKIGVLTPLTGEASQWGIPPKEGVELALGKLGKKIGDRQIKVIYEDTQCEPSKGITAAQKLINIDKVDAIIGAVCSSVTLAIAPLAEQNKVVLISPASTNPKISDAGDYIFRVVPSDALRGEVFADYIKNNLGLEKVAILYINNEGGAGNKDSFKNKFEKLGGKVVDIESYEQGSRDIKTQLMKIASQKPQGIIVVSYPADTVTILKQAKEMGLSIPLYFQTEAPEDPSVISAAGDAANGITYILPAEPTGEAVETFKQEFKKKFGKEPALYAAEGFDAFNLIVSAIKQCQNENQKILSTCIKDKLYSVKNYKGASGIITFDSRGDVLKSMAIKKIENGKKKVLVIK